MKENPYQICRNGSDIMRPAWRIRAKDFLRSSNSTIKGVCYCLQKHEIVRKTAS